jgi:DNA-binding MarR family transcriptional regulator
MVMYWNENNKGKPSYALLRVVSKLVEIEGDVQDYGTGVELHEAEIHMISFIKENPGEHLASLAERAGVTRGAVSQIAMKLERKGMVEKLPDSENLTRLRLRLTPIGEKAYAGHAGLHKRLDALVDELLAGASDGERAFLSRFFADLEMRLEELQ